MATVYLARDLRHHRAVALKVLRPELAALIGAERFLAEIRTTANLQHPHILPLFDSGQADGLLFYVMPFVEGESLRERLTRERQLPVPEALRITREVASALDYAHRHGVIHRDIKPENILLTKEGDTLVADFGIALAVSSAGARMTETGMSLGTPYYMSPEQATGERTITGRADVYALGAVLYEMLTGEPPFTGPTAQAILAKVMTERPVPIRRRRQRVPAGVEAAILTSLEKLPADRFASGGEFVQALEHGTSTASAMSGYGLVASRRKLPWLIAALIAGVVLALGGFVLGRWTGVMTAPPPPSRLAILAPTIGGSGGAAIARQLALSADGSTVVYVALRSDGEDQLVRQRLDEAEPTAISGAVGLNPQISPDGRWVLGSKYGKPYRVPIEGGTPEPLPPQVLPVYGAWAPDGQLWFSRETGTGLAHLVRSDSVAPFAAPRGFRIQQFLDERTVLAIQRPIGAGSGPCLALDIRTLAVTPILSTRIVEVRYTGGYLVYALPEGTLQAVAFDPRRRRILGEPVRLCSASGSGQVILPAWRAVALATATHRRGSPAATPSATRRRANSWISVTVKRSMLL